MVPRRLFLVSLFALLSLLTLSSRASAQEWSRQIETPIFRYYKCTVREMPDGSFLATYVLENPTQPVVVRISSTGSLMWSVPVPTTLNSLCILPDSGWIAVGSRLTRGTATGSILWSVVLPTNLQFKDVAVFPSGGYLLVGTWYETPIRMSGAVLRRVSSTGELIWQRTFFEPYYNCNFAEVSNSHIVFGGGGRLAHENQTKYEYMQIVGTDTAGVPQFSRMIALRDTSPTHNFYVDMGLSVTRLANGDFLGVGSTIFNSQGSCWFARTNANASQFTQWVVGDGNISYGYRAISCSAPNGALLAQPRSTSGVNLTQFHGEGNIATYRVLPDNIIPIAATSCATGGFLLIGVNLSTHFLELRRINAITSSTPEPAPITTSHTLVEAYPNPFNAQTTVRISLAESSPVTLAVLDITGREVYSRNYGPLTSGEHRITLDATSWNASSGVYFIRATTRRQTVMGKVAFVK